LFVDITCTGANVTMSDLANYRVHIYPALSVLIVCWHYLTGANVTMSDLSNYRVHIYPALSMSLRSGHVIHTLRPPSSGAILAFMLRVLEGSLLT